MAGIEVSSSTHYCYKCGEAFGRKKGNFPVSYSFLYKGGGHLPYCAKCIDEMFNAYLKESSDARSAVRQMCRKLDLYWNAGLFDGVEKVNTTRSMMTGYFSKINTVKYAGKCYDDTLREEGVLWDDTAALSKADATLIQSEDVQPVDVDIPEDIVAFWGPGYTSGMYLEMEARRKFWMSRYPEGATLGIGEEALIRQICNLEIDINHDRVAGKAIDKNVNTLNTLLGSANLKPAQKKGDDIDAEFENMPFGVGIRRWENTRPVPETEPELRDVDSIVKYITIWFFGHLCKMLGIKNSYCKLYEEELERLRVKNPEFEDDDDESLFNNIFGGDST